MMSGSIVNLSRLLIVSHDVVGSRMAGPGIRYWEMARAMSDRLETTLVAPGQAPADDGLAAYTPGRWETLAPLIAQADALLFSGDVLAIFPQLAACGKPLVLDVYAPHTFETVHLSAARPPAEQMAAYLDRVDILRRTALAGDFFICATERQRDYWLGILDVCGRANAVNYAADPTLRSLIDLVPFGLPSQPPPASGSPLKGQVPGIEVGDRVILWGGGLWEWLDPLTLVRAVGRLCKRYANLRLVFFSARHPNPNVPDMPMRERALALSNELGLTGKYVFFLERWISHEEWPAYLLDADIGASLHLDTLETRFAFRTRIVDYIWASLPMVVTGGDETSGLVASHNLGVVVPPGDVDAVVAAITRLLDIADLRAHYYPAFERARPLFEWKRVCEPVVRFCQQPRFAPDRAAGIVAPELGDTREMRRALAERDAEAQRLCRLVESYECGKFIRATRQVSKIWQGLPGRPTVTAILDQLRVERFFRQLMQEVSGATSHTFVDRAYWRILHRAPDLAGFETFCGLLARGEISQRQVVARLVGSIEFRTQPRPEYGFDAALHLARCQLVRQLPPARDVLDLGGAALNSIQGALFVMGYPHRVHSLTIIDLPPADRLGHYYHGDSEKPGGWIETEMGPIRYFHASMTNLSAIEDNSLDLVFAGQSIEHVSEDDGRLVMREVLRVLRPGGYFCLDTPNGALTRLQSPKAFIHPEHQVEYRVTDLVTRLGEAGFVVVETRGICPMPRSVQTGVFDEREALANASLSDNAEVCYLFYVKCAKPRLPDER